MAEVVTRKCGRAVTIAVTLPWWPHMRAAPRPPMIVKTDGRAFSVPGPQSGLFAWVQNF
jgi:hypothetical protein